MTMAIIIVIITVKTRLRDTSLMTIWCLVPSTAISEIAKWRIESSNILPDGSFWNASINKMKASTSVSKDNISHKLANSLRHMDKGVNRGNMSIAGL